MGTRGSRDGGLAHAQEQIAGLVDGLDRTLDLVVKLSEHGEDEAAIKLLDGQRAELYRVVNSIARNAAIDERPTWFQTMRRHATAMAAAAVLVLSTLAMSVHAITRQTPAERAERGLQSAQSVADPVERIRILIEVVEVTRTLPPEQAKSVTDTLIPALNEAADDAKEQGADDQVVASAQRAASDLQDGQPPHPPATPATDEGPLESLTDLVPDP